MPAPFSPDMGSSPDCCEGVVVPMSAVLVADLRASMLGNDLGVADGFEAGVEG